MNREIKFRFWLGHIGKMTYSHDLKEVGKIIPDFTEDIIPLQFTGLKDKNDVEIYEGDFLMVWDEDGIEYDFLPQVVWGGNYPAFDLNPSLECEYNELQHATLVGKCEVVGNIYENPELLSQSSNAV